MGEPQQITTVEQINYPLSEYFPTQESLDRTALARHELITQCVARFGLDYIPPTAETESPALSPYRYGLVSVETASQFGYRDPENELGLTFATNRATGLDEGVVPTDPVIVFGPDHGSGDAPVPVDNSGEPVPEDGCRGEAEAALGEPPNGRALEKSVVDLDTKIPRDSRFKAIVGDWTACMEADGYAYDSPMRPSAEFADMPDLTVDEVTLAVADATCRQETNYVGRRLALDSAYQQQLLDENPEAWSERLAWNQEFDSRVETILAGADSP